MPAWSDQTPAVPCLPLIPAVPQGTAWGIFWKGICCFLTHPFFPRPGLACSICVQHLPSLYPCRLSSSAVPHHCFMLETQRSSSSSCAWNAQQFVEGWERSASKKHKMWLWSGLFYWLFLPHLKIFKGFFPSCESCLIPIACMLQGSQLSVWWLPTPLDMPSALWPLAML